MTTSPKPTKDEAIRTALDSAQDFINSVHYGKWAGPGGRRNDVQQKIIAAREALAQPAADDKPVESGERAELIQGVLDVADALEFEATYATTAIETLRKAASLLAVDDKADGEVRGLLSTKLKCWHRLTAEEAQELVDFFNRGGSPVGYTNPDDLRNLEQGFDVTIGPRRPFEGEVPIYTRPQPQAERPADHTEHHLDMVERPAERVALSDAQTADLWNASKRENLVDHVHEFKRAVEAAHGITGKDQSS